MNWTQKPTTFGWYFFTKELKDWDLSVPVAVSMLSVNGGPNIAIRSHNNWDREEIKEDEGWWYGPIKIEKPDEKIINFK